MVLTFETEGDEVTIGMQIWLRQRTSARKELNPTFRSAICQVGLEICACLTFYGSLLTLPPRVCHFKLKLIASGHFVTLMIGTSGFSEIKLQLSNQFQRSIVATLFCSKFIDATVSEGS